MNTETERQKEYRAVEHLNAAVNIFRKLGRNDLADKVKGWIREFNQASPS